MLLELKELQLRGRKYTWSNDVTQTRIDRAFRTIEWDLMLPNCALQAASSFVSDHCPHCLLLEVLQGDATEGSDLKVFGQDCRGTLTL